MVNFKIHDLKNIETQVDELYQNKANDLFAKINQRSKKENDFKGWLYWPNEEYQNDRKQITKICDEWDKLKINKIVVIGIGGSHVGIKAGIDMCASTMNKHKFIFVSSIDEELIEYYQANIKKYNWAIIVISKSGTTFETSINFRIFRNWLFEHYQNDYHKRIVCITGKDKSLLYDLAKTNNYQVLSIPEDIGGRFSIFTCVGLLVFKLASLDIDIMTKHYVNTINQFLNGEWKDPLIYALTRYLLLTKCNKHVEVFATYNSKLRFISEHYKQIFAESEGKVQKCLIPTIANYSNDLHSIGQLYQEGSDVFFETHLKCLNTKHNFKVPNSSFNNDDKLDYLTKYNLFDIENAIRSGVIIAHSEAKKPCLEIEFDKMDEISFVELILFLNLSATCSAYLLEVNPFNQPGVEAYKSEIKRILK